MADKGGPRDWDKELAEIDKLIASSPAPAPAQVPAKAGRQSERAAAAAPSAQSPVPSARGSRRDTWLTWLWFSLAVLMGVGLTFLWPYRKDCGMPLYGFLGSIGAFALAALWSTGWSWRTRAAVVHYASIGLLFWAGALAAMEVLPRIGYAKDTLTWECRVPTPPR